MESLASHPDLQRCIDACLNCYKTCLQTAMNHCLEAGGSHVEARHFRLMMNCAEICRTTADLMLSNSPAHASVCAACAQVCEACAESCEQVGEMEECVAACAVCVQRCQQMSGPMVGAISRYGVEEPAARH